jgi:hypothetical protein
MSFDKAGSFLLMALKKYKLENQATASWVCEIANNIFEQKYPRYASHWDAQKFEKGILSIQANNSTAAGELFLRTWELIEVFEEVEMPQKVKEIRIVRK